MDDATKPIEETAAAPAATPKPPTKSELAALYYDAKTAADRKSLCEQHPFLKQTFSEANHPTSAETTK